MQEGRDVRRGKERSDAFIRRGSGLRTGKGGNTAEVEDGAEACPSATENFMTCSVQDSADIH